MTSSVTARKNGKNLSAPVCRHSPGCELAQGQQDLKAQFQSLSEAVGLAFERLNERLDVVVGRVEQVHTEHLDHTKGFIETNDHILRLLRKAIPREG